MNKKRILIIGGKGYIGKALTNKLSRNTDIFATGKVDLSLASPEKFLQSFSDFDLIINLAAKISAPPQEPIHDLLQNNVTDLSLFLEFLRKKNFPAKILHVSSMAVYTPGNKINVSEDENLNPKSFYGLTKKMAEEILAYFSRTSNIQIAILRLPGVYGGNRQDGFVYLSKENAKKNLPININTANLNCWETMHIDDVVNGIEQFTNNYNWKKHFDYFNLGYGRKTDIIDLAHFIKQSLQSKSEIKLDVIAHQDFYMDTHKINQIIQLKDNFEESLIKYIQE